MSNCCSNSFYSDTFNAPDCSVDCISTATPGALFVGSTGNIYVLTGEDPCDLSNWDNIGSCCINFVSGVNSITICRNEELNLTSQDNTINIDIDELTGIDFSANIAITFSDDYSNDFVADANSSVQFSDANGIIVQITSDGHYLISGNSYSGSGSPGLLVPTHASMTNYYFDTTNNVLYVWKASTWTRINYLPSPVSLFSYTKTALAASFAGTGSTSTQAGISLTYQWTGSGPGTVTFATPTASSTTATFSQSGSYIITLTVTDSNGTTKAFSQTVQINPKNECDVKFEISSGAFLDPDNPLDSEVTTWISANGPFNNGTILYYVGSGTAISPEYIWYYTC